MKQLLITIILTLSFVCQGQSNSYKDFDYNDIIELKGLFYLKSDTTLVTGRIIRYNKKKEAKRYVFITNGKPNNLGWIQFNSKYEAPKESALGSVLTGAALVTATVLAVSNNDPEVPIRNMNNQNSVNGYFNEQKDNSSIAYREMSERNKISEDLNNNKEENRDHLNIISNIDLLETKGNYIDEKKDGIWETFYANGKLKSKGVYIMDNKDGLWVEYDEDGKLEKEVVYKMGKKEGLMKVFQKNNLIKAKVNYKNGREDGDGIYYDDNGQIEMKINYKEGKIDGSLEHYKNGQLVKIEFWKDGVLISN